MKKYLLLSILILLVGCTTKTYTEDTFEIEKSEVYSLKEYRDLFSSLCSPKTVLANAKVIEKSECSCPEDPTISCDCYIFSCGGTFSLGDDNGIIEYYDYCSENEIWEKIEKGKKYLFTLTLSPNYIRPSNNVQPYNDKFPILRKSIEEYRKGYDKQCKEKTYQIKAKVAYKEVCFPPAVEGIVFKCDTEDKLVIESGGLREEFTSVSKNVLKIAEEGHEYVFILKQNNIIDLKLSK